MYDLLHQYLIQHHELPLQGIACLRVENVHAGYDASESILRPPQKLLRVLPKEKENSTLQGVTGFICRQTGHSEEHAYEQYLAFCEHLKKNLDENGQIVWPQLGKIIKLNRTELSFIPASSVNSFFSRVPAVRALHNGRTHSMVVGDRVTDSAAMQTELEGSRITDEETTVVQGSRWWIGALILALSSIFLIVSRHRGWV